MESQAEVVAAAEAVRTWVRTQRSSWATAEVARFRVSGTSSLPQPPSSGTAARAATSLFTQLVNPAPVAPWSTLEPGVTALASSDSAAAVLPDATFVPLPVALPPSELYERPSLWSRGVVRAAAALLILGLLGGAGFAGWRRFGGLSTVGTVRFDSQPSGTQVMVDGNAVGETPVQLELSVGSHAVEFRTRTARRSQTVQVRRGLNAKVAVDWNTRRVGGLQVTSTPAEAKVLIDGHERGVTPLTLTDVTVGSHTVLIVSSEGTVRRKVDVSEGKTESLVEEIYPGWLHVTATIDLTVLDGTTAVLLDDSNRVLLKPGAHSLRIENRPLEFSVTKQVDIEPGATSEVAIDVPASTLNVAGTAGADVFVDGAKAGPIPLSDYQVKLGVHDIMVVAPGGETRHATVTVTTRPAQLVVSFSRR